MAKNNVNEEIKATEKEVVDVESTEVEVVKSKKKIPFKKILLGGVGAAVAVGGAALAIASKIRQEKEVLEYMKSCGNEGTESTDDSDEELKAMFESENNSEE